MKSKTFPLSQTVAFIASLAVLAGGAFSAQAGEKVEVCHVTGSETNSVKVISVSANALDTHLAHGDVAYDVELGCEEEGPSPI